MDLDPLKTATWTGGRWDPGPPAGTINGVFHDTRRPNAGGLYAALSGERYDGHLFVARARGAGASGAMVRNDFHDSTLAGWPLLRVADTKRALWNLADGARSVCSARIIGVTGSVGKTTVKEMIAHMLAGPAGKTPVARTYGNWNNDIGLPLSILQSSADAVFGVFEIGSNHPGELRELARLLRPSVGVITTVGRAHAENFESPADIAREKAELFRSLPPAGTAILNGDHGYFDILRKAAPARAVTVSMQPDNTGADYRALSVKVSGGGLLRLTFADSVGDRRHLEARISGRHQAANLLLAAATVRELGGEWNDMREAAASFQMPEMRWQRLRLGGVAVVNDAYNACPMSMRAAIETFDMEMPSCRRWLVLGGMMELGNGSVEAHRAIGRQIARKPWQGLITVGENASAIAEGALEKGFPAAALWECADAAAAAAVLRERLKGGDAILLKGSRVFQLESIIPLLDFPESR